MNMDFLPPRLLYLLPSDGHLRYNFLQDQTTPWVWGLEHKSKLNADFSLFPHGTFHHHLGIFLMMLILVSYLSSSLHCEIFDP